MNRQTKKRVYVAMSGGVDSSVAAALLKKEGCHVTGVFMKPWSPSSDNGLSTMDYGHFCPWQKDREDAMRVAAILDIPFKTWDFSKKYKKSVTEYMIREYRAGKTPNPDVMCNKEIKFGLFLKKALRDGADFIATGHYIKIKNVKIKMKNDNTKIIYQLLQAKDKNKDQSYFLWTLTQEQLKYCLFPIGEYTKPEVRKLAKKFKLPNHNKKDSQGVCFIGPLDMKSFLKDYIKSKKGLILDLKGNTIGGHDGACYYTIGQRHGLDIKNGQGPYYVVKKDLKKNIVYVGDEKNLFSKDAIVSDIHWINKIGLPASIEVKIRYRSRSEKIKIQKRGKLIFLKPVRAITSGQSAVFYRGNKLLGGGIIN